MASPSRLPSLRRAAGSSRPVSMIEAPMVTIPNPAETFMDMEPTKKAKRRSLLPQFSRKGSLEEKEQASSKEDITSSDRESATTPEAQRTATSSIARGGLDEERSVMPPPPKPTRPMSMIPPRGSSQASKLQSARSHTRNPSKDKSVDSEAARAQSLAALTGTSASTEATKAVAPEIGLKRSGSTRLPQTSQAGGPTIPSRTTSVRTKGSDKSSPSKATGRLRPAINATINEEEKASSKSRVPALNNPSLSQALDEPPLRPRPASLIVPTSSKPAFNTYQQHYSPAKSSLPKPPVPSGKHAPKSSATLEPEEPANFDASRQQIELLQLSLLHQSSTKCLNDYAASAKRKLGKMHSRLRKEYENVRAAELVQQRASNLSALDAWCPDTALLVENLQILSLVHSDVTSLLEDGSRHGDVVSMFELWMNEAETSPPGTFIQPLPEEWRASHGSVTLKLRTIQRNLRVLPPVQSAGEGSSVEMALRACRTLVEDMLKELEVMVRLEKEMMAREKTKVKTEVDSIMANTVRAAERWKPAWQAV